MRAHSSGRVFFDMGMSNSWGINKIWRVRSDSHSHSHKWRHAAAAMRANNVLRNSYNTRPLLCVLITCYVTVIFSISLAVQSVTSLTALLHS
jgi:hypothetical protein